MYQINDIVVYRRDVCKVIGTQENEMTRQMCYVLVPYDKQDGSVRMQVPVSSNGLLRNVVTKEEVRQLIEEAPFVKTLESKPANMKSQYAAVLKGDQLKDLVCIIKTSFLRNKERLEQHKKLASIDDEYMKKAERLLFSELSVALGMSFEDAKQYFDREVSKAASRIS